METIILRGMKRSGNHLLLNWIMSMYEKPLLFNDYPAQNIHLVNQKRLASEYDGNNLTIFSFEIPTLVTVPALDDIRRNTPHLFCPFILRDPLNWIASYIHKAPNPPELYKNKHIEFWDYWLQCYRLWKDSEFQIKYNEFVANIEYRKAIAAKFKKDFCSERDSKIMNELWFHPAVCKPSSFDTENVVKNALRPNRMKVLERYELIQPLLDQFKPPEEILEISKIEFNIIVN